GDRIFIKFCNSSRGAFLAEIASNAQARYSFADILTDLIFRESRKRFFASRETDKYFLCFG
ncbi:hypothetical protein Q5692_11175, partial [Microcoleus sp. C2C3]|uniref:hypothetical protein n=1 Tax=unclassified Microcoleus TaxID=2642155 RepID=UPI002FD1C535